MILVFALLILIFSVILHEVAHGFVADKLGDPTARISHRLTLNPLPHIDPVGTIFIPLLLLVQAAATGVQLPIFGWAKPVPIDPFNFRNQRKDMALTAVAGPLTNLLLAVIAALLFHIVPKSTVIASILSFAVYINLVLGILNLIPIPPLDGSKFFALLLPKKDAATYLSLGYAGFAILFILLWVNIGNFSLSNLLISLVQYIETILGV